MKHVAGISQTLVVRTQAQGAPNADGQGSALSQWASGSATGGAMRQRWSKRYRVRINVSAVGTSCTLTLWGKDALISGTGAWGVLVDSGGNFGVLASGAALPSGATYYFVFEDIGIFNEIVLVQSNNVGGTPVVTATMTELVEENELG